MQDKETLLLKHCINLQRLSDAQLIAVQAGQFEVVKGLLAQRQIIVDGIRAWQAEFAGNDCQTEIQEKLRDLLRKIVENDNISQQILEGRCDSISQTMRTKRQAFMVQRAYDQYAVQGHKISPRPAK